MITRDFTSVLKARLIEKSSLIQVILGPRQVGKTTGVHQVLKSIDAPSHYASADESLALPSSWIVEQWQKAKSLGPNAVLIIDEIQKIIQWSESIKLLWDAQQRDQEVPIKCVLLGSSSLELQKGLSESLAGRFEVIPVTHWSFAESKKAFGFNLETYLTYGGYPGTVPFMNDYQRWYSYMKNSIIETVIGKDILGLRTVGKPALFRQTFELLCSFPAQEISFTKLLGQLQEKGNTDLIQHYIELYEGAFLFKSLKKYSKNPLRKRSSSPKILPLCPSFYTLMEGPTVAADPAKRGRLFESVVGADLARLPGELYYWREGDLEIDYVYQFGSTVIGIEVKSGGHSNYLRGIEAFRKQYSNAKTLIIDFDNYEEFSSYPVEFLRKMAI